MNQSYIEQIARAAYIASICQPEATYIPLNLSTAKLFVFVDGSFANNKDLSSQIGYVIVIANEILMENEFLIQGNMIHWSSVKSKRVTRSVVASEILAMVGGVNIGLALSSTFRLLTEKLHSPEIPIIVYTDSYSL